MHPDTATMLDVVRAGTSTITTELTREPLVVDGKLPPELDGVMFRNGPGRFERGNGAYGHPFDGDGHVLRLEIGSAGVHFSNRFVRTGTFLHEEQADRIAYRAFGTNIPGGVAANLLRVNFKNAANTSVVWHAGRLLALWEGGPPHRLDPETLETRGTESFDGMLRNPFGGPLGWLTRRISPLLPFSAHPRIDAVTHEMINFGLATGRPHRLLVYQTDGQGRMARPRVHPLRRFSFVHDFAVTDRWLCFLLPYADFALARMLLGLSTPVASLRLDNQRPMQLLLIPRDRAAGPDQARLIDCVPGFVFHIAQGFDREDGRLVLDVIRYPRFPALDDLQALYETPRTDMVPRLERLVVQPDHSECESTAWSDRAFELPTSAPGGLGRDRRFIYGIGAPAEWGAPYFTAIQRVDTHTGALTVRDFGADFVGEPVVVPGPGDSAGWLLTLIHRAADHRTELVVLNAADLTTCATAALPCHVPLGFHGCWVPRSELTATAG